MVQITSFNKRAERTRENKTWNRLVTRTDQKKGKS